MSSRSDSPLASPTALFNSGNYTIRPMTCSDIPAALALLKQIQPEARNVKSTFFTQMLHDSSRVCLLAFPTHKLAAPVAIIAAALHVPTDDLSFAPAPSVDMLALGVLPSHRRKHLGAHLVSVAWRELALPAAAAGLKTPRLRAVLPEDDESARAFWKALGLSETPESRPWRSGWRAVVNVEGVVVL